ncbi:hypothetical protein FA95DRAFT_916860 [Auriscalpium vulgare]|uniref:Uncharacterized protein n=1 Tax=Auriscalpium vulgare TaxID=40419 RepID=A0ACB8R868_9AGAM|nr:hypothetical protein FA95DRAFT_916860 [Auriscalpium vulgare]
MRSFAAIYMIGLLISFSFYLHGALAAPVVELEQRNICIQHPGRCRRAPELSSETAFAPTLEETLLKRLDEENSCFKYPGHCRRAGEGVVGLERASAIKKRLICLQHPERCRRSD